MGNTCGIVDVVAWSLVKQCDLQVGAVKNVAKWYNTLSSLADMGEFLLCLLLYVQ